MLQSSPYFRLKSVGEDSLLQQKKEERVPLFMSDLQALLTYCLCGDKAPYWPHRCVHYLLLTYCIVFTGQ